MGRKATRSAEEIAKAKRDMFIRTSEKRVGRILDGLDMLEGYLRFDVGNHQKV